MKTHFNDLETGRLIYKYKRLTSYENYITDLIISDVYKYFITSTLKGSIFVWKLTEDWKLIHSYKGHARTVTSLVNHPDKNLFISSSLDNTIRIWCLDKFVEIYSFRLISGLINIWLLSDSTFSLFYEDWVEIGELRHLAKQFTHSNSITKRIGILCKSKEDKLYKWPFAVFI